MIHEGEAIINENIRFNKGVATKIGEHLDFLYDSEYYKHWCEISPDSRFAYLQKDQPCVEGIFHKMPEILSELAKKSDVKFIPDCNLNHILGNSILIKECFVEKRVKNNVVDENFFVEFKKDFDFLIYYLEFLEGDGELNKLVLKKEISDSKGWLSDFSEFYISGNLPSANVFLLKHFNFFARLSGWQSGLGKIKELEIITGVIEEENFDQEFEKLAESGKLLDKEKIKTHFFGSIEKQSFA